MSNPITTKEVEEKFALPQFISTCEQNGVKFASEADASAAFNKGKTILNPATATRTLDAAAIAAL